jgi:hypothetical protein
VIGFVDERFYAMIPERSLLIDRPIVQQACGAITYNT